MATPSQIKSVLDDIAKRIAAERSRLTQAKAGISTAKSVLDGMPAQYGTIIGEIEALQGDDAATLLWKAEAAALVAERICRRNYCNTSSR